MAYFTKVPLLLICICALISGCVSTPPPIKPTPVENRETSVLTPRETMEITVNRELFKAAFHGNTSELKVILESEVNEDVRMKDGWIALLIASGRGHPEAVQALIDAGVDINGVTARGGTALMWAAGAQKNSTETVRVLLEAGANVNAKTSDGYTALMDAAMHGNTNTMRVLLEAGAGVNAKTEDGVTALMEAGRLGHLETVRLLLANGAEVNVRNREGRTALMEAKTAAYMDIVQLLRNSGASDEPGD
jgi:ankyrin repeat protein